jgi:hypothetical protein
MALTQKKIGSFKKRPDLYLDGGDLGQGLYMQVSKGGASWLFRYEIKDQSPTPKRKDGRRERWMGLGSLKAFTLKEARDRAKTKRQLLCDGVDPLDRKNWTRQHRRWFWPRPSPLQKLPSNILINMKRVAQCQTSGPTHGVTEETRVSEDRQIGSRRYRYWTGAQGNRTDLADHARGLFEVGPAKQSSDAKAGTWRDHVLFSFGTGTRFCWTRIFCLRRSLQPPRERDARPVPLNGINRHPVQQRRYRGLGLGDRQRDAIASSRSRVDF